MPSVRARAAVVALVLGAFLMATTARADDAQQARELFTQGNTFFDLGQFDKAIDAWQKGYQLKNDPGFLYNIAQAYRVLTDAQKAIFFYKRYLSNAPKAHNREEVEQKIEALQKQLSAQEPAKPGLAPGPVGPGAPAPAAVPSRPEATSPPLPAPPAESPGGQATPVAPPPESGEGAVTAAVPEPDAYLVARPLDLGAAIGIDTWASGVEGSASPSFALSVSGGYTFGQAAATVRFRLGALFGYTFLQETSSKDSFVSFLIDPTLELRLSRRFRLDVDLGLGVLAIGGLNSSSALLASSTVMVNGTQAFGEARIGVSLQYSLTPALALFAWPAIANSPKKQYFHGEISRVELLAGVMIRP
jgi:hypothetical protein